MPSSETRCNFCLAAGILLSVLNLFTGTDHAGGVPLPLCAPKGSRRERWNQFSLPRSDPARTTKHDSLRYRSRPSLSARCYRAGILTSRSFLSLSRLLTQRRFFLRNPAGFVRATCVWFLCLDLSMQTSAPFRVGVARNHQSVFDPTHFKLLFL